MVKARVVSEVPIHISAFHDIALRGTVSDLELLSSKPLELESSNFQGK